MGECASAQRHFRHPFLCQVREVFRYRYQAFNITGMATESFQQVIVFTEHCGAGELQWHTAGRPVADAELVQWMLQISAGLSALHSRGLLHRNINPGNIYKDHRGHVKLGSFQFAKFGRRPSELLSQKRCGGGTPMTLAPEVLDLQNATAKADVWALGCLIYAFATGRPPQLQRKLLPQIIRQLPLRFGNKLRAVLRMTLQTDPELRCDASEVFEWLSRKPPKRLPHRTSSLALRRASQQIDI